MLNGRLFLADCSEMAGVQRQRWPIGVISCAQLLLFLLATQVEALTLDSFQGFLVVLSSPRHGQQLVGNISYHARTRSSKGEWMLFSLVFAPNAIKPGPELKTGDNVQLVVDLDQSGYIPDTDNQQARFTGDPGTMYVWSMGAVSITGFEDPFKPVSNVYYTGVKPLQLSMVVWVVRSVCGRSVEGGLTEQDISEMLFGGRAGVGLQSQGMLQQSWTRPPLPIKRLLYECSYGNFVLKRSQVLVLDLILPCNGERSNGVKWYTGEGVRSCGKNDLWGWMEYAVQKTKQTLGIDPSTYLRRVLVLPPSTEALCPNWQQLGSFGCDNGLGCDMWLQGDPTQLPQRLVSQLGSSMLLQPALSSSAPVGSSPLATSGLVTDPSCSMGVEEDELRCFNGPNSYKLLLAQPLVRLDDSSYLFVGSVVVVELPPAALSAANLLLVVPNWQPPSSAMPRPLYGQYRAPVGGDGGLSAVTAGRLVLHSVNATVPPVGRTSSPASVFLVALSPGESYRFEPAKVILSFKSWTRPEPEDAGGVTGGSATVEVCRYSTLVETDCYDGDDNDCDGLVDDEDPDCAYPWG